MSKREWIIPDSKLKRIDYVLVYQRAQEDTDKKESKNRKKRREYRSRFINAMSAEGLQIQKEIGENVFLKIHVPFQRLLEEAQRIKLQMPLADCGIYDSNEDTMSWWQRKKDRFRTDDEVDFVTAPFQIEKMYVFEGFRNSDTFFRPSIRYYLTNNILINIDITDKVADGYDDEDPLSKKGLPYLILKDVFKDAYILHDEAAEDPLEKQEIQEQIARMPSLANNTNMNVTSKPLMLPDTRQMLNDTWGKFNKFQPMWKIRNYFGEKIAFYFAWSGMLITTLWIPTIVGICIFIYGLESSIESHSKQSNSSAFNNLSAVDKVSSMVDSSLGIFKESFDNNVTPFYALIICLWGTIFLEMWKRKNAQLAYEWDVNNFEENEPDRPEFYGTHSIPDPIIPGEFTMFYPNQKQFLKFMASASTSIFMVVMVFISVIGVITYRVIMSVNYCGNPTECMIVTTLVSSVLNAASIMFLGKVYEHLAAILTNWENHRTQTLYDDAMIIKLFAFQFANNYTSLFYIAFFRGSFGTEGMWNLGSQYQDSCGDNNNCMSMLSFQVLVLMLSKPLPKFFTDLVIPYMLKKWKRRTFWRFNSKVDDVKNELDNMPRKVDTEFIERERQKPDLEDFTLGEYTEKVVVYGFLMLFAASFPLAPLIALLVNFFDIKIDCKRMLWIYRRPISHSAQDIGTWYSILQFLNIVGVVSNAFLVAFTSSWGKQFTTSEKLWIAIGFEHIVFAIKFGLAVMIPDVPSNVKLQMRKEQYQVQHILEDARKVDLHTIARLVGDTNDLSKGGDDVDGAHGDLKDLLSLPWKKKKTPMPQSPDIESRLTSPLHNNHAYHRDATSAGPSSSAAVHPRTTSSSTHETHLNSEMDFMAPGSPGDHAPDAGLYDDVFDRDRNVREPTVRPGSRGAKKLRKESARRPKLHKQVSAEQCLFTADEQYQ